MNQTPRPSLLAQFLVRYALMFVTLFVGFAWYDAAHKDAPPKPSGTISWDRVLVAMACALVAGTIFEVIQYTIRRRNR